MLEAQKPLNITTEISEDFVLQLLQETHRLGDEGAFHSLKQSLFSSHRLEYDCYLNHLIEKKKCSQKHNVCRSLFKCLTSLYSDATFASFAFKTSFRAFASTYKDFKLTYKMLIVLTEIIGFDLRDSMSLGKIKYQPSQTSHNASLNILNELFDVLITLKIDLDCQVNDVKFNDFVANILKSIISQTRVSNVFAYKIISKIIEINPLIIESKVDEIIVYIMLNDNRECRLEYGDLLVKMFELFSKLHRIQNFISKMIRSLQSALENGRIFDDPIYVFKGQLDLSSNDEIKSYNIDHILPLSALNYFSHCIVNLASWQVINLFKTVTFHLGEAVKELGDFEPKGCIYIEILSCLTCWVLSSVRIAEHTVAPNTVVKFVAGLDEFKAVLAQFGRLLLQREHHQILMRTFLTICFHWAEIYMTIEYYSFDKSIHRVKVVDSNISGCNLTYLHPYLTDKEWCLVAERIHNFGEKPCKQIMQKLILQKMKAFVVFQEDNDDVIVEIIRTLSTEFEPDSVEIFMDKFVVGKVLNRISPHVVVSLAEVITRDLLEGKSEITKRPHVRDSELLTKGIISVVFTKINKLLKQKRKHDDVTLKKAICAKIIATLPANILIDDCSDELLEKAAEIVRAESVEHVDLTMHETKICDYLNVLTKVPVIFCPKNTQKFVLVLLFALHKDSAGQQSEIVRICESIIISVVQHNRFTLLDVFNADVLLQILINFERCDDVFDLVAGNVFKTEADVPKFEPGIKYIKTNVEDRRCLKFATTILHLLKTKKLKMSSEAKQLCLKYKTDLSLKIVKIITKKSAVDDDLVEPFVLVLKHFLVKDEDDALAKLKGVLQLYVEYCFENVSDANVRGYLLLFATVLHNKPLQLDFGDDFVLRIWNNLQTVAIKSDIMDEYCELLSLVASLIPSEHFGNIFADLLTITGEAIEVKDWAAFCRHLKTWTSILSTNFNPGKTNMLRQQLELLLEKLIFVLKYTDYAEELFNEIIQFEVSIVQANHVPLTAAIVDFLLLNVSILMQKSHFEGVFNASVSLLQNLLKHRNPLIMDRLPPFLMQYRVLLKELCTRSGSKAGLEPHETQANEDCAHKLEKLTRSLTECQRDMGRIAMYLVADILREYEVDTLDPSVKKHLNNCIYSLIGLCDQHAVQFLMRVLSNASTEMFKTMFHNYRKFYRFTGKV